MILCPTCGQVMDDDEWEDLDLDEELECPQCTRHWVVSDGKPFWLDPPEGREQAFTD
jgi:hypothetical protein